MKSSLERNNLIIYGESRALHKFKFYWIFLFEGFGSGLDWIYCSENGKVWLGNQGKFSENLEKNSFKIKVI